MSAVSKFLKMVDFSGSNFTLRIGKEARYKSDCGGCISLSLVATLIFAIISFGKDFVEGNNYVPSREEALYKNEDIPFVPKETTQDVFISLSLSRFLASGISFTYKNTEGFYVFLPECSEAQVEQIGSSSFFLNFCIEVSSFDIGLEKVETETEGEIKVSTKKKQIDIKIEGCDMTSEACQLREGFSQTINLTLPIFNFISSVKGENSIQQDFITKTVLLEDKKLSLNSISLSLFKVFDDVGWLLSDVRESTRLTFDELQNNNFSWEKPVLEIKVELGRKYQFNYRRYDKLQDVSAMVGGFMKIISSLFSVYGMFIQRVLMDRDIINEIFNNYFKSVVQDGKKTIENPVLHNNNFLGNSAKSDKSGLELSAKVKNRSLTMVNKSTSFRKKDEEMRCIANKKGILLAILYSNCCCFGKQPNKAVQKVQACMSVIYQERDYFNLTQHYKEFEGLKHLLLNEKQTIMLRLMAKPLALAKNESPDLDASIMSKAISLKDKTEKELREMVFEYCVEKMSLDLPEDKDRDLFNWMEEDFKEEIKKTVAMKKGQLKA